MFTYMDRIPIKVLSNKGIILIEKLNPGDYVYEFNTGKLLEVKGIIDMDVDEIYEATFSDNRKSYYHLDDLLYFGNHISTIKHLIKEKEFSSFGTIVQKSIEYEKNKIRNPLVPDPYVAGALLIYGSYDIEGINLPINMNTRVIDYMSYKYDLDYGTSVGNYIRFTKYNDIYQHHITWEEFFPQSRFYAKTHDNNDPLIPDEYFFGTINDREQFIRGIFDTGSFIDEYKDFSAISHSDELMLNEVQKILWSLGILSEIIYNPNYNTSNKPYHLTIMGKYNNYPGLFYDINNIEKTIENRYTIDSFKLQLENILWRYIGYTSNLILEKPNMCYISDNFLARVSL